MKHFLLACLVLCAPHAAYADPEGDFDFPDTILSSQDAVSLCESWNYKANVHSTFFHKADAASDACHAHFGNGQFSKNAVEFCKSAHSQGVIELLFVRCLDAFPTGRYSKNLISFCDKTFYDWTNDESNPRPVPAFRECLAKVQGKSLPDETVQSMTNCRNIKKQWGDGEGTDAYTVWHAKISSCIDNAMNRHVDSWPSNGEIDIMDSSHSAR